MSEQDGLVAEIRQILDSHTHDTGVQQAVLRLAEELQKLRAAAGPVHEHGSEWLLSEETHEARKPMISPEDLDALRAAKARLDAADNAELPWPAQGLTFKKFLEIVNERNLAEAEYQRLAMDLAMPLAEEALKSRNNLGVIRTCLCILEWAGRRGSLLGTMTCLWCRRTPTDGHRQECLVGKMIREANS